VCVRGQEADVDVPFSDIFDNLDLAFSTHLEARKRESNWGWFFDVYWADLGMDFDKVTGNLDMQMTYLEAAGAYNTSRSFQLFFGFRYISMDTTLKFEPQIPVPPQVPTRFDGSQSWTDLMVGGRWKKEVGEEQGRPVRHGHAPGGTGPGLRLRLPLGPTRNIQTKRPASVPAVSSSA
jgi:hypothetical protein